MKTMHKALFLALVLLLALVPTALGQDDTADTITDYLSSSRRFDTMAAAIEAAGLQEMLSSGEWTIFAPTDAALARLGLNPRTVVRLSPEELYNLVLYHVLPGNETVETLKTKLGDITMANGQIAGLKFFRNRIYVNDFSRVVNENVFAGNGTVHVVNRVIEGPWPRVEEAAASGDEEGSASDDGEANAETTAVREEAAPAAEAAVPPNSIAGIAAADGRFDTLVAAAGAAGLVDDLSSGSWTLFAPTDAAFARLGLDAGNIADEFTPAELADLLLYHALPGDNSTDGLKAILGDVTMANGRLAGLKYYEGDFYINDDSKTIQTNILADNGTIHVVDTVIQPPWPRD